MLTTTLISAGPLLDSFAADHPPLLHALPHLANLQWVETDFKIHLHFLAAVASEAGKVTAEAQDSEQSLTFSFSSSCLSWTKIAVVAFIGDNIFVQE